MAAAAALESRANSVSLLRLACFSVAAVGIYAGIAGPQLAYGLTGAAAAVGLFVAVIWHSRIYAAKEREEQAQRLHERHLLRSKDAWQQFEDDGREHAQVGHAYAHDVDLFGPGSLMQAIDVSQTVGGSRMLAQWLGEGSDEATLRARQEAVCELAGLPELRWDLELQGALGRKGREKLDPEPFRVFTGLPSLFAAKPWLKPLTWSLPLITLALFVAGGMGLVPSSLWLIALIAQIVLLWATRVPVHRALDLITSRLGLLEALEGSLRLIEGAELRSARLKELQGRLKTDGALPSVHLRRLRRYEGFAQLRTQGPVYLVLNVLTLWDLFCLERLERFNSRVGPHCAEWFETLSEFEALSSLAGTMHRYPGETCMPELASRGAGLAAEQLAHPLLPVKSRVANDLQLGGPGSALLITGSNMAGKSTLLRAVGLNVALGLAGGPVCARRMTLPRVRLRASMRIDDSLQQGASYFRAELNKLRSVLGELDEEPPVLFLLDELLRGTNATARHQGARAVLEHLLGHGAFGLVATHDVALAELEETRPEAVRNQHLTDVFEDGEMRFDYLLRDGVVKTSNALRLLRMAGVEVPEELVS